MLYEVRNQSNLAKLADNTRAAALAWYKDVSDAGIEILVYETIRTKETQAANIKKGVSQTMKSYHLVGQALDWVLCDIKGATLWNDYDTPNGKKVIELAKKHGFESGADWRKFVDKPHLEYHHKGYGTDTFGQYNANPDYKVIIPNTAFWQARNLVIEFKQRGYGDCYGQAVKKYGIGETVGDNDPYLFVIETDFETAQKLVIELQQRGYDRTFGEKQ